MNIGGGGDEVSIEELAKMAMKACGYEAPLLYTDAKPGDIRRLVADNTHAKEVIGYVPKVSLAAGLAQYVEYARGL